MVRGAVLAGVVVLVAFGLAGCSSVDTGASLNGLRLTEGSASPVAHMNAESWGIYLLPIVPLLTGDTGNPGGIAILSDTVRVEPVVGMLTRSAKNLGAAGVDGMSSSRMSFPILPPIIWYKSCQVSGNAIK